MKRFKTGNPATRPHKDQRPSSSEKHPRGDGYLPSRFRSRTERALRNIDAIARQEKNEDISVLLTHIAVGNVKHYPTMQRANVEASDPHKRSFSLEWKGGSEKQGFKLSQYDQPTKAFALRAKFYMGADSSTTHQVSNITPKLSSLLDKRLGAFVPGNPRHRDLEEGHISNGIVAFLLGTMYMPS